MIGHPSLSRVILAVGLTSCLLLSVAGVSAQSTSAQARNLLDTAARQIDTQDYLSAKQTLQQVKADELAPADRERLEYLTKKADAGLANATRLRRSITQADQLIEQKQFDQARRQLKTALAAAKNDDAAKSSINAKLAEVDTREKIYNQQMKDLFQQSVADYNAGRLEQAERGFKAVVTSAVDLGFWNRGKPEKYLRKIAEQKGPTAFPSPVNSVTVVVESAPDAAEQVGQLPVRPETYTPALAETILTQRNQAIVQQELQLAQTALQAKQFNKALLHSKTVLSIQPNNAQAREIQQAASKYVTAFATGRTLIDEETKRRKIIAEQIAFQHKAAMDRARHLIEQQKFAEARNVVREAQAQVKSRQTILPAFAMARMNAEGDQMIATISRQEDIYRQEQIAREQTIADERALKVLADADEVRQARVKELFFQAATFHRERKYELALDRYSQILTIDPNNQTARELRTAMQDTARFLKAQAVTPKKQAGMQEAMQNVIDDSIPRDPESGVVWAPNWEELSDRRLEALAGVGQDSPENVEARRLLAVRHPRFDYAELPFSEVIDHIRETTGLNIVVNWTSLETAGIEQDHSITLQLNNVSVERALKAILDNISSAAYGEYGYSTVITYSVQDGIVTIANSEDLARDYYTVVHDISDLLLETADYRGETLYEAGGTGSDRSDNRYDDNRRTDSRRTDTRSTDRRSTDTRRTDTRRTTGTDSSSTYSEGLRGDIIGRILGLIINSAPADSWRYEGTGEGTVEIFGTQLLVYQTAENHTKITDMLNQIRQTRPIQISVEPRFLFITDNFLEDIGIDLDFFLDPAGRWTGPRERTTTAAGYPGFSTGALTPLPFEFGSFGATRPSGTGLPGSMGGASAPTAFSIAGSFLDKLEVDFLIRATQATSQANTMTAPRVTFENGGGARIFVGREVAYVSNVTVDTSENAVGYEIETDVIETGPTLNVAGVVSPDRRFVRLEIEVTLNELIDLINISDLVPTAAALTPELALQQLPIMDTTTITTQVSVPDGGALLIGGLKRSAEEKKTVGIPVISKLPYINRLFTNKSKIADKHVLVILLRPKIIDLKEAQGLAYPMLGTR